MTIYLSSDWHFFHHKITLFCPNSRNFSDIDEMNKTIIDNCNRKVRQNDELYILGDVSFGRVQETVELLQQLSCKNIHLIIGNHDHDIIRKQKFRECFVSVEH